MPEFLCCFDTTYIVLISVCSPNICKGVFNPNVTTFQLSYYFMGASILEMKSTKVQSGQSY